MKNKIEYTIEYTKAKLNESDKMNILSFVIHEYIEAYMRMEGLK